MKQKILFILGMLLACVTVFAVTYTPIQVDTNGNPVGASGILFSNKLLSVIGSGGGSTNGIAKEGGTGNNNVFTNASFVGGNMDWNRAGVVSSNEFRRRFNRGRIFNVSTAPKYVWWDSDSAEDVGDNGGQATGLAMDELGYIQIIGMSTVNSNLGPARMMRAINIYYGRDDIPVARSTYTNFVDTTFADLVSSNFFGNTDLDPEAGITNGAVEAMRRGLVSVPDHSLYMITGGQLLNVSQLYYSPPDSISPLTGDELMDLKLNTLIVMAGNWPYGTNTDTYAYNFHSDPVHAETLTLLTNKSYAVWYGDHATVGGLDLPPGLWNGSQFETHGLMSPLYTSYFKYGYVSLDDRYDPTRGREAWDEIPWMILLYGTNFFTKSSEGVVSFGYDLVAQTNNFTADPGRNQFYWLLQTNKMAQLQERLETISNPTPLMGGNSMSDYLRQNNAPVAQRAARGQLAYLGVGQLVQTNSLYSGISLRNPDGKAWHISGGHPSIVSGTDSNDLVFVRYHTGARIRISVNGAYPGLSLSTDGVRWNSGTESENALITGGPSVVPNSTTNDLVLWGYQFNSALAFSYNGNTPGMRLRRDGIRFYNRYDTTNGPLNASILQGAPENNPNVDYEDLVLRFENSGGELALTQGANPPRLKIGRDGMRYYGGDGNTNAMTAFVQGGETFGGAVDTTLGDIGFWLYNPTNRVYVSSNGASPSIWFNADGYIDSYGLRVQMPFILEDTTDEFAALRFRSLGGTNQLAIGASFTNGGPYVAGEWFIIPPTFNGNATSTTNGAIKTPSGTNAISFKLAGIGSMKFDSAAVPGTGPFLSVDGNGNLVETNAPAGFTDGSGLTNLLRSSTASAGWGMAVVATKNPTGETNFQVVATNALTLIATNSSAVALDFTSGTPRYRMDAIHAALTVNPTNIVGGREIVLTIHNPTASTFAVTITTNGWTGAIKHIYAPNRSGNVFYVTNGGMQEISFKSDNGVMLPVGGLFQ